MNIVVGDADSLIALAYKDDAHHKKARQISDRLLAGGYKIIYPNTAILEAITTLKRALNLSEKAIFVNKQYQEGAFNVKYVDEDIQIIASRIFDQTNSKKNTIFDAIVAATAKELDADGIFSFDLWYPKLGFKLVDNNFPD